MHIEANSCVDTEISWDPYIHWYKTAIIVFDDMSECPTVPLWAGQSRFGGKCPVSRGDLARDAFCPALGEKVTCATACPTCRMQSALSCICQSTKTARGGARQRTTHVERQSTHTHTHDTVPMPKSDGMGTRTA